MNNLQYCFTEHNEIKISWERDTQLFKAEYYLAGQLLFVAKEKELQKCLDTLELMSELFLGKVE